VRGGAILVFDTANPERVLNTKLVWGNSSSIPKMGSWSSKPSTTICPFEDEGGGRRARVFVLF
jgi:hypothetical protein